MSTHRIKATINKDGTLILTNLPFKAGDSVEVLIKPEGTGSQSDNRYPLRGKSIQYKNPTEPVANEDWEVLK
jgi:hypothetical protein